MHVLSLPIALLAVLAACTAQRPQAEPAGAGTGAANSNPAVKTMLASSKPADGAVVIGPVDTIELHFAQPARLTEVTIVGADGTVMPIMVTAAGEVQHYSLPVSGLEEGRYTVRWRATSGGRAHQGDFAFEAR